MENTKIGVSKGEGIKNIMTNKNGKTKIYVAREEGLIHKNL